MTAVRHGDAAWDPAEVIREQAALLAHAARGAPPGLRAAHLVPHLRDEVLGRYDVRFLACDDDRRRCMVAGTRGLLADWLTDEIRTRLPVGHRMRAFCIEHDLVDELARLVADEAAGHREGAVVVGGRVYAVYPYLRGVPRQDADITAEVGVEHRLDAVSWAGDALLIRGRAAIERVAARDERVEIVLRLRATGTELKIDSGPHGDDHGGARRFAASVPVGELRRGHWDVNVSVRALGLVRAAPLGAVRAAGLVAPPPDRPAATAYFTGDGHLAIAVRGRTGRLARTCWRRLTRRP